MGFFDRFTGKKNTPAPASAAPAHAPSPAATPAPASPAAAVGVASGGGVAAGGGSLGAGAAGGAAAVKPRLLAAREALGLKDLAGALAIYEEVLAGPAGDRADVLVAISGDLGSHGHVAEIVELVAPRYDADRHGPATGLNLLQAYLALRQPDAAQHVLDILFELNRPELEDRLHGFSNAIAEMLHAPHLAPAAGGGGAPGPNPGNTIALITVSKPIWFYGLEPLAAQILPPKEGRLRRVAFAQLAIPGFPEADKAMKQPEEELGRLARALPLWFAETFYFSAAYAPVAAIGLKTNAEDPAQNHPVIFPAEWTMENLRQLVETSSDGVDYIVTGALQATAGDYELTLRVWEVKGFRERKAFTTRWTPATADAALLKLHADLRTYLEWSPTSASFVYAAPAQPRAWLDTLGASLGLFLAEKSLLPTSVLAPVETDLAAAGGRAAAGEAASFAWLTLRARARGRGLADGGDAVLARSPLVQQAKTALG
jgi:hypothetical protein